MGQLEASHFKKDESSTGLAARRHPSGASLANETETESGNETETESENGKSSARMSGTSFCPGILECLKKTNSDQSKQSEERGQFTLRQFAVPFVAIAFMLWGLTINALVSGLFEWSLPKVAGELMWRNASVRPPMLVVLVIGGWGWVIWVCRGSAMNLELVLGGPPQSAVATCRSALCLLAIMLAGKTVHVMISETPGITWRPWLVSNLLLHAVFILLAVLPMQVLQSESRSSLVRALYESVIAPFGPVTFWHVIVADYLTSMAKAFSDIQMSVCISTHIFGEHMPPPGTNYVRTTELWQSYHDHCNGTYSNAVVLVLPFWWRLMQCLKVYSHTREQKNLWNALKYSTAFPLVYAGYLKNQDPSPQNTLLFIAAAVIQSSFTFVWDVLMDWGLPQRAANSSRRIPRDNPSCFGFTLRERLLATKHKRVYLMLMMGNFMLRFAWTLSVFGAVSGHGGGMFFFQVIEVIRRTVWAVFRIEWEVLAKDKRYLEVSDVKQDSADSLEMGTVGALTPLKIGKESDSRV